MRSDVDASARDRQTYVERLPRAGLRGVVRSVWVQHVASDAAPLPHRNLPHGGVELVADANATVRVAGPLTRATGEVLDPGSTVVGLRFAPAMTSVVLGVHPGDMVDGVAEVEDLWGDTGRRLAEAAAAAASPDAVASLMEDAVADRIASSAAPDPLVRQAVRFLLPGRSGDVRSLAAALAISDRQLRRRCHAVTGMSPKDLHVILRFQGFLALAQYATAGGMPAADGLSALATTAGYADQSHLTRDCQRLTGLPPGAFLADVEPVCGCGHDHAAAFTPLVSAILGAAAVSA